MLPDTELQNFYPIIMTPSHDGKYFHNYTLSLLNAVNASNAIGMQIEACLLRGESLITRARNNCVAMFLENQTWTHLVFVDSDIGFSDTALYRLLLSDKDVAAGIYPLKRENWPEEGTPQGLTKEAFESLYTSYTVNHCTVEDNTVNLNIDADGFMEIDEAPTGFMCIKREVLERMIAHYPEYQYRTDSDYGPKGQGLHYNFFDCSIDPESKRYLSEDYHFCHLWRKMGGKIYVDTQSNLTHQGSKMYQGAFAETLVANPVRAVSAPAGNTISVNNEAPLKVNPRGPN